VAKVKERAEQSAVKGEALVEALKANPYVQRVLADELLRDQVKDAVDSSRAAYKRASKSKQPAKALISDQKLQRDLRAAFESARAAQEALKDAPAHPTGRRKGKKGRLLLLTLVGGAVALVASSSLRDKVLDLLFGPEETFDYVPASNGAGGGDQPAATSA